MLRKIILLFLLVTAMLTGKASKLTDLAGKAYSEDKFSEAVDLYNQVIAEEGVSSDVYYNLGNAYYKSGYNGKAILCYERALLLNPGNSDAKNNLDFVNSKLKDKFSSDENIVDTFADKAGKVLSFNGWAILAIVSFILLLVAILVYFFNDTVLVRKVGFFGGFAMLLLCIISNIVAFKKADNFVNSKYAIVTKEVAILSNSPREPRNKSEEAFMIHEGAKVEILDSVEVKSDQVQQLWYNIKADDTHIAWIKSSEIEKI